MADWVRGYRDATGQSVYGSVITALEEFRERVGPLDPSTPAVGPEFPRPVEGRIPIALELPHDVHQWLRLYCAINGRRGESVIEQALSEYRSRVESQDPCTHR